MVEMLGVLAIIGVLSVAGMAGYSYALVKYKANETMDELNKRSVLHATQLLQDGVPADGYLSQREFGDNTILGYGVEAKASVYENEFEITLRNYPSEVCRDILKNYTIPIEIIVGNTRYNPESDNDTICGDEIAPDTVFVYTADLETGEGEGTADEYEGTYGSCTPGVEFKSGSACYPCDEAGHYVLSDDEEHSLCSACGRDVFQGGSGGDSYKDSKQYQYCAPVCRSDQVYHMGKGQCVIPPCRTNADCDGGKYCDLDAKQNGETPYAQPQYGTCKSSSGRRKEIEGYGIYVLSSSKMNWWSAGNFCNALKGELVSMSEATSDLKQLWKDAFGCYGGWFKENTLTLGYGIAYCQLRTGANHKNDTKNWVGAFCRLSS